MSADFQRVYHLRLTDAIRDRTVAEVWDLVVWLPQGGALSAIREADGDDRVAHELFGWTYDREIAVGTFNAARETTWVVAQAHSSTKIPPVSPEKSPRNRGSRVPDRDNASNMARRLLSLQ